jgi:hypothetical protein
MLKDKLIKNGITTARMDCLLEMLDGEDCYDDCGFLSAQPGRYIRNIIYKIIEELGSGQPKAYDLQQAGFMLLGAVTVLYDDYDTLERERISSETMDEVEQIVYGIKRACNERG